MDPWTIIGWIVLAALVLGVALVVFALGVIPAYLHWCHMRTRDVPPATGQVWLRPTDGDGSQRLTILEMLPTGNLRVRSDGFGRMEFTDTPDMWARRVRAHKLILIEKGE